MEKIYLNKTATLAEMRKNQLALIKQMESITKQIEAYREQDYWDDNDICDITLLMKKSFELCYLGRFLNDLSKQISAL